MNIKKDEQEIIFTEADNHKGAVLIDTLNGAKNGFCMGISYYHWDTFGEPGIHDDQEGFFVLEGTGYAKIGEEVFPIHPGLSFIAHAGAPHTIRKNKDSEPIKILWCHGAI